MKKYILPLFIIIIILLLCSSCSNQSKFKTAESLEKEGKFEEAALIYDELGSYNSSSQKAAECREKLYVSSEIEKLINEKYTDEVLSGISKSANSLSEYASLNKRLLNSNLYDNAKSLYDEYISLQSAMSFAYELDHLRANYYYLFTFNTEDYSEKVDNLIPELEEDHIKYERVNAPSVDYVTTRLNRVDEILRYECATEDNDPSGGLNTLYGYNGNIFFTCKKLQSKNEGKSPLALGVKGGGCIEIYPNEEDAAKRYQYLKYTELQGTKTGVYVQYGTLIIWLSPELSVVYTDTLLTSIENALTSE